MDLVLGLSVTSTAVRWVLVEGWSGDGKAEDRGTLDVVDVDTFDAEALLTVLLDANEAVVESGLHAIGVTWTADGDATASAILEAFYARGHNVVPVSEVEAAEALAGGIADIAGYDDTAVCIFEPDATLVALVNADGVTVDRQASARRRQHRAGQQRDRAVPQRSPAGCHLRRRCDRPRTGRGVDGHGRGGTGDLLGRGGHGHDARRGGRGSAHGQRHRTPAPPPLLSLRGMSKTRALTTALVAASVTLVVSLSVALGLRAFPDSPSEQARNANATAEQAREATVPSAASRPGRAQAGAASRREAAQARLRHLLRHRRLRRSRRRWSLLRPLPQPCPITIRRTPGYRRRRQPRLRLRTPRRPRPTSRRRPRNRRSLRSSQNRACATRSSSASRSSTGSTSRSTRRP